MTQVGRWILDWQDRSRDPDRRVRIAADSIDEVREAIERLLTGSTWTPPDAEEFAGPDALPAFQVFKNELMDIADDKQIFDLWSGVNFECDDGALEIIRER
ncbi:MAG TPA: hypothetical protein VHR66_04390 [Gemmataceae bacterium]|jgi:hypothetical protein|nr:hypothetical protein [Gemmataceae bacterium]